MRTKRIRRAAALAVAGVLLAAAGVLADTVRADGDVVSDGVQGFVTLDPVAPGAIVTVDVSFLLECSGTSRHVDADQSVTLTLGSRTVPQGGNATATNAVINPPGSAWPADGSDCSSNPTPIRSATVSHVTLTAPNRVAAGLLYTLSYTRSLSPSRTTDTSTFSGSTNVSFTFDTVTNTRPVLTLPGTITVEGDRTGGANVSFSVTANDAEDGVLTPTCDHASGDFFALGDTTVSCSVPDSGGLTATGSFHVVVRDTTAPVLANLPGDMTVVTNNPAGIAVSYANPTASDVVDASPTVSCALASGSNFPVGDTPVTCTATDDSGNATSASFNVHVHLNVPPVLSLPADMTVEGNRTAGGDVTFNVGATDAEDGTLAPSCDHASGSFFALGSTRVSCSVSDSNNLATTGSFLVTIRDTTAPTMSNVPSGVSLVTNNPAGAVVTYTTPSASDAVDANPTVGCTPPSGSTAPVGNSTVTCTATDASGNSSTATFTVSVRLDTAPVLTLPGPMMVEGNRTGGAVVNYTATASDVEDGALTPSCDHASGSFFARGDTTVGCTVTDANGRTDSGSFRVTVRDTTAPSLSGLPSGLNLTTSNPAGATIAYAMPNATDVVDSSPTVTCAPASGSLAPVGDSLVTCTARDDTGNTASASFPVHVTIAGSNDVYDAGWESPIGGNPAFLDTNGTRTVPVKLRLYRNGAEVTSGSAFLRLTPCAVSGPTIDLGLTWNGSRWTGKIDTSTLSGTCYNVVAMAGDVAAGSFRLDVTGGSPTKSPGPVKGPKSPNP
jgi:large repetitive protein